LITEHPAQMNFILEDMRIAGAVAEHVKGQDAILHLAGHASVASPLLDPTKDADVNTHGTLNLLEAARLHNPEAPFLFASTSKVYGKLDKSAGACKESQLVDFNSPESSSSAAADQHVRDYARRFDMNTVVLRLSSIYGTHQYGTEDHGWVAHFVHSILSNRPFTIYGDGTQVRDLLDARDLSALCETVIEKIDKTRGQVYNIGGGPKNKRNLIEVIDQIGTLTSRRPQYSFAAWRAGDSTYYVSDIAKAKKELGWTPQIPFDQGLKDLIAWAVSVN
jgi:CDP-paratose 2-epimerase